MSSRRFCLVGDGRIQPIPNETGLNKLRQTNREFMKNLETKSSEPKTDGENMYRTINEDGSVEVYASEFGWQSEASERPAGCPWPACRCAGSLAGHGPFHRSLADCPQFNKNGSTGVRPSRLVVRMGDCDFSDEDSSDSSGSLSEDDMTLVDDVDKLDKVRGRLTQPARRPFSWKLAARKIMDSHLEDVVSFPDVFRAPKRVYHQVKADVSDESVELYETARKRALLSSDYQENRSNELLNDSRTYRLHKLTIGLNEMEMTYPTFQQRNLSFHPSVGLCEFCLASFSLSVQLESHERRCTRKFFGPPGIPIYKKDSLSVYAVDGRMELDYCRMLTLVAKAYVRTKMTSPRYMGNFRFFVLTRDVDQPVPGGPQRRRSLVGFFSREKRCEESYNLAVIVILPPYQRLGYGRLLIDLSYYMGAIDGRKEGPERPLSDSACHTYHRYWKDKILDYFESCPPSTLKCSFSALGKVSAATGLSCGDLAQTLQKLHCVGEVSTAAERRRHTGERPSKVNPNQMFVINLDRIEDLVKERAAKSGSSRQPALFDKTCVTYPIRDFARQSALLRAKENEFLNNYFKETSSPSPSSASSCNDGQASSSSSCLAPTDGPSESQSVRKRRVSLPLRFRDQSQLLRTICPEASRCNVDGQETVD